MPRRKRKSSPQAGSFADELQDALVELSFIEIIDKGAANDRVRVLMRVHDDASWLPILKMILREERRQEVWSVHVCRQFMLHPDDDQKLVFAWNFVLRGKDVKAAILDIRRVIDVAKNMITIEGDGPKKGMKKIGVIPKKKKKSKQGVLATLRGELSSYPLMADENRNMPEVPLMFGGSGKRKGAHLIGG